jgi:hypothetical protein
VSGGAAINVEASAVGPAHSGRFAVGTAPRADRDGGVKPSTEGPGLVESGGWATARSAKLPE